MKLLTIIPARGGSKGIPGKNIRHLGGIPLIGWSIASAKEYSGDQDLFVNTDSDEIAEVAGSLDCRVYRRPAELGTDTAKSIDVVLDMLESLNHKGTVYDAVCLLQPTYPFRAKGMLGTALKRYLESEADSLISVLPVPHHYNPHWVFEAEHDFLHIATGENEIIPRRQDLPPAYHRDGAIYLTSVAVLTQKQSFFGNRTAFIISDPGHYVNIDTPADWEDAEQLYDRLSRG